MLVSINGSKITLFQGATLKHALLKTDQNLYEAVMNKQAVIKDQEGNLTNINGAAADGWAYTIETTEAYKQL
ncbi:hypothetical protein SFC66_11445 [Terribacillus saccharophilus]|uniref:hypothetical protein n=1 Tax=Terribacillus saccharophilus TaxID=361277 RepID=UPI00398229F8